jgi:hypothetical protein
MSDLNAEKNKAIVLEAFDTLFNERDYIAAEQFCSSKYIQHSAHIEPSRDGLFNLVKAARSWESEDELGDFLPIRRSHSPATPGQERSSRASWRTELAPSYAEDGDRACLPGRLR